MKLIEKIKSETGADLDEIKNVFQIMDYFLEGFKGSKGSAIRHLEKMKKAMFIDISESDWLEWLSKDMRRWAYVEMALRDYEITSRKSLMNTSYMLFVSDIYDMMLSHLKKGLKRPASRQRTN